MEKQSVLTPLMDVHRTHVMRVCALLQEEASILGRCALLEELIEAATWRHSRVDTNAASGNAQLPPLRQSEPHPVKRETLSCETSIKRPRSEGVVDGNDEGCTTAVRHRGDASCPVQVVSCAVEAHAEVKAPTTVVEDESPPAVQCTPSEILEECEMLFGGPSTGLLAATSGDAATMAKRTPAASKDGGEGGGGVRAQAKSALRDAFKKERHPRALVSKLYAPDKGPPRRQDGKQQAPDAATMPQAQIGHRHQQPPMTPDAYWDVGMGDGP